MSRTRHVSAAELQALQKGCTSPAPSLQAHLETCEICAVELVALKKLAAVEERESAGTCPDPLDLSLHASGRAEGPVAMSVDRHLRACEACALDFEALLVLEEGPPPPRLRKPSALERLAEAARSLIRLEMPVGLTVALRGQGAGGDGPHGPLREAMQHYEAERWAEAAFLLEEICAGPAAPSEAFFYLGACLLREGRTDEAVSRLREAVWREKRLGTYRWYLGQALASTGRIEEALDELRRAARHPGTHQALARELARKLKQLVG